MSNRRRRKRIKQGQAKATKPIRRRPITDTKEYKQGDDVYFSMAGPVLTDPSARRGTIDCFNGHGLPVVREIDGAQARYAIGNPERICLKHEYKHPTHQ